MEVAGGAVRALGGAEGVVGGAASVLHSGLASVPMVRHVANTWRTRGAEMVAANAGCTDGGTKWML
jgi:hypothetical protein